MCIPYAATTPPGNCVWGVDAQLSSGLDSRLNRSLATVAAKSNFFSTTVLRAILQKLECHEVRPTPLRTRTLLPPAHAIRTHFPSAHMCTVI